MADRDHPAIETNQERRVLVLMPSQRDAERMSDVFRAAGMFVAVCGSVEQLSREIRAGAGAAVLTEETLRADANDALLECLKSQPPWSSFPLVVLTHPGTEPTGRTLVDERATVTLIERPLRVRTLVSVMGAALRAREYQYQARDALEAQARQGHIFETVLAGLEEFVYTLDLDGRFTFVNQPLLDLWGRTSEEALGRTYAELGYPPALVELHVSQLARVIETGAPVHGENSYTSPAGKTGFHEYVFVPLVGADGRVEAIGGASRDVTVRRQTELALRESEARLRQLAEAMPQIVWTADGQGRIDYFNQRWYEQTGAQPGPADGARWPEMMHPDDRAHCVELWERCVRTGEEYATEVRIFSARNGEHRWNLARAVPVQGPNGEISRWIGTSTDIHAQKSAEEALRMADRRKDEFLAMLAHELRNPLAPLRNGLQILQLAAGDPAAGERARRMMERQLSHLVRLVDDLMDVSRISRGKVELRRTPVNLSEVAQHAIETSRPLLEARRHRLTVDFPAEPIIVYADATRLSQAFSNLLNNAAKYSEPEGEIGITIRRSGGEAVVTVRDSGIGIPREALSTVFEMFSQVNRSFDRSQGGLGIGLTLVKSLVEMHGGSVAAFSDGPGAGSELVVRLPAQLLPGSAEADDGRNVARTTTGRRVLVVDDNEDAAESLAMMLELLGSDLRTAHDGLEALEVAASFRPEVILLDIGMPRLDGYETARRIRAAEWGKDVLLVALTGWGQEEDRRRSREAGFNHHLVKPVDPEALLRQLAVLDTPPVY